MLLDAIIFWFLSLLIVISGLAVILFSNPIYSALSLVMTMVGVASIFITLAAYFIAGVQIIVYTGAVMVLFVMVLMLFNLNKELSAFSRGRVSGFFKMATIGILAGLLIGAIGFGELSIFEKENQSGIDITTAAVETVHIAGSDDGVKKLATNLFTSHVLSFELLGVLLLVIAVGVVTLARSKGGTHARD